MILPDILSAIEALNLEPIKLKLMHKTFGEGWSQARVDAMEIEYRRFLYLQSAFPDEQTSPTLDVDTFWHYHILDTVKYAQDCEQAFGYFLHHYPYLGMLDSDEDDIDIKAANRTRELYEATFGESYMRSGEYSNESMAGAVPVQQAAARCQACASVARPIVGATKVARCQVCTVARPAQIEAKAARCQASVAATPKAIGSKEGCCQNAIAAKPAVGMRGNRSRPRPDVYAA
jgi:hypothetical protein